MWSQRDRISQCQTSFCHQRLYCNHMQLQLHDIIISSRFYNRKYKIAKWRSSNAILVVLSVGGSNLELAVPHQSRFVILLSLLFWLFICLTQVSSSENSGSSKFLKNSKSHEHRSSDTVHLVCLRTRMIMLTVLSSKKLHLSVVASSGFRTVEYRRRLL